MFNINNIDIGSTSQRTFIIAEVGQSHEGSLDMAHAFIDAVSESGADAVKFQTHIASAESTLDEQFRIEMRGQDKTRFDYWKRMEFSKEQWIGLKSHAEDLDLIFLSSPFSVEAVELLNDIGIKAWKLGSGEIANFELLQAVKDTKKPVFLSTGMSDYDEIDKTIEFIGKKTDFALFQCTSQYPSSYENVGLNVLDVFRNKYQCPVGLSDHTGTVYPALAAIALGADLIEFHITLNRRMSGPDVSSSITVEEAKLITDAAKAIFRMNDNPVDKNILSKDIAIMKKLFNKSVALVNNQKKGTVIKRDMLTLKKPGNGIPFEEINNLLGSTLKKDVQSNRLLQYSDLVKSNIKD